MKRNAFAKAFAMQASALGQVARQVVDELKKRNRKIVFAESCTGGLVSAVLTEQPGVSEFLCGSAVVYQLETKAHWLHVPRNLLRRPGPVSRAVVAKMAVGVLAATPQADVAAAITGHLGPRAPKALDGIIYVTFARRGDSHPVIERHDLSREPYDRGSKNPELRRVRRQKSAAAHLLRLVYDELAREV